MDLYKVWKQGRDENIQEHYPEEEQAKTLVRPHKPHPIMGVAIKGHTCLFTSDIKSSKFSALKKETIKVKIENNCNKDK